MNKSTFDEMVKARANQVVQGRIKEFKQDVGKALSKLYRKSTYYYFDGPIRDPEDGKHEFRRALEVLLSDTPGKSWPKELWEEEEQNQLKSIMDSMDSMQKAVLALQRASENNREEVTSDRV